MEKARNRPRALQPVLENLDQAIEPIGEVAGTRRPVRAPGHVQQQQCRRKNIVRLLTPMPPACQAAAPYDDHERNSCRCDCRRFFRPPASPHVGAAEELILEGRVGVNGEIVRTLGSKADPETDEITFDGRRIRLATRARYILLNKPRGYVTTRRDPEGRRTVMDLLAKVREVHLSGRPARLRQRWSPAAHERRRLAARLTHPRHGIARVYEAIVVGDPEDDALDALRRGLYLEGDDRRPTAPAGVRRGTTIGNGRQQTDESRRSRSTRSQPSDPSHVRPDRPPGPPAHPRPHGPYRTARPPPWRMARL